MDKDILINLIEKKLTQREMASQLKVCQTTIKYWLKKYSLSTKPDYHRSSPTIEKIDWTSIQNDYDTGKTYDDIVKIYKISCSTISKAKKMGFLKTRNTSDAVLLYISNLSNEERLLHFSHKGNEKGNKGGYREGSGRGKKFKIKDFYNSITCLQSTYELKLSIIFNHLNIKWVRPSYFKYNIENKTKKYFPDFYLEDYNLYIDTKNNYLAIRDEIKLNLVKEQNNINLYLFLHHQISLDYIIDFLRLNIKLDKVASLKEIEDLFNSYVKNK